MANHSTSSHRHIFILLLLMAALLLTCTTAAVQRCPSCGATPVPWPLSTAASCGDQLYKLRCSSDGALFFDTTNNTYPVTAISPENQRLTIQPSPFLPNTCVTQDISSQGVQLSPSSPFNITSSNTVLYLNCSDLLLRSPLNCSAASLCHVYLNGSTDGGGACGKSPICCSFRAGGSTTSDMIRVRESGCRAYRSFVNLDYSLPVSRWPEPGMELQWVSPREPICGARSDCDPDSSCGSDPNSNPGIRRCFCNSGFHWDAVAGSCARDVTCEDRSGCSDGKIGLIAGLSTGLGVGLFMAVMGFFLYKRHQRIRANRDRIAREREDILNYSGGKSAKLFTGREMKKATGNFSRDRLLGVGGYGEVYRGTLDDGTVVAIKCAKLGNSKGTDQVLNEVRILCQVNHKSLVGLLGCCVELEQPLMVYEYVSNGTLLEHLQAFSNRKKLSWNSRLQIARATADALAYLHFSALPPIYHRDVKSSNILLDDRLNAKVSDFGLSRLAETDLSHISTCAQGTLGYLDPEYYRNYQLTDKSDVYSFGVVMLELLTSQRAIDFNRSEDDVNLAVYVQRLVDEERMMEAVDPVLKEGASDLAVDTIKAFGFLAMGCLEPRRQDRPSMKEVVEEIEYIISIANSSKAA